MRVKRQISINEASLHAYLILSNQAAIDSELYPHIRDAEKITFAVLEALLDAEKELEDSHEK